MDIEQRLEQAEQSDSPSLVGASIRSADDSSHNNYIHPEKYKSSKEVNKIKNYSKLNSAVTASLDDLINEGALLNSEADFDNFLDQDGTVKTDAKFTPEEKDETQEEEPEQEEAETESEKSQLSEEVPVATEKETEKETEISSGDSTPAEPTTTSEATGSTSFYKQDDYSTPNLSEFQLDHDIKDHNDLLDHVKSYDLQKLPTSSSSSSNSKFRNDTEVASNTSQPTLLSAAQQQRLESSGGLHTPYFHTERARSRSRSANPSSRIRDSSSSSQSASFSRPHLARGDSYKSTHEEEPTKYELPADLSNKVQEEGEPEVEDERRSRQSRPTMGESIAAAEALAQSNDPAFEAENPLIRDPSLVTTGDYTNFEVDSPRKEILPTSNYYTARSESSTNYLRSISRSRSRARNNGVQDEKNDANNQGLVGEGALVSDDPYSTIDQLDTMVEEILHVHDNEKPKEVEKEDSKTEKDKTTHEELIEKDIEHAKEQSNEKDDANTQTLSEEGALVNEDDYDLIDKKNLEEEGISTEGVAEVEEKDEEPKKDDDEEEEQPLNITKKESETPKEVEEKEIQEKEVEEKEVEEPKVHEKEVEEPKIEEKEIEEPKAQAKEVEKPKVVEDDDLDDLDISPEELRKHLESQPIYIFTSLAGGMQIMPRTNRLATILQANGIKFEYRDLGTDEPAKKIWKRQAAGKTLPGVVRGDDFIGNWQEIDEANEEYKLRELLYETL
ncbi:hypothetical protein SBY92_003452 [Candida maltosa Xu316]